jgi:Putative zinc-finger
MQHLDEGTIHAWLDGGRALDEAEAARVEAHVAECATCAAAVAEARGLIAGASRVLSALDHAPANVVPTALKSGGSGGAGPNDSGASADAPGVVSLSSRRSASRRLHVTQARLAAAAVILVAAVSLVVAREERLASTGYVVPADSRRSGPGPQVRDLPVSPPAPVVTADSSSTPAAKVAVAPAADSVSASRKPELAQTTPAAGLARNAEIDLSKQIVARRSRPAVANDVAPSATPGAVSGGARAVAASPPAPQPTQLRRAPEGLRMEQVVVTSLKDSTRADKSRSSDSVVAAKEANQVPAASAARAPEAYAPQRADNAAANKRFAAVEARGLAAPLSPLGAAGCYEITGAVSDSLVPKRFVLDTSSYALREVGDARVVTIPGESATLPRGYWRLGGGAAQIVWNDRAWPPLTIVASPNAAPASLVNAIVDRNGLIAIPLRRCAERR